ncbi:MAG: ABC transporter permease [Anaerolineae bacterium]|jgi:ABC-type nitrate/sulfonate/bicarbonate transport system permease component
MNDNNALPPPRNGDLWSRIARYAPPATLILTVLMLWQLATALWQIQPWLLPSPLEIVRSGVAARGMLGPHVWQTARETVLGFALALMVGLSLGLLIDFSPTLHNAVYPVLVVSQTIPLIAIAPLLVIWFGYGIWPKIIVVGLICFFPIVVSTADGLRATDPELMALLRTMGASRRDIFTKVRLPGAMPAIFSGIKIAITYSVVGAILGEWVGGSRGLGIFMLRATNSFRTDWVFVSIAITAVLSVLLFGAVTLIERAALPWYYTATRQESWEELS